MAAERGGEVGPTRRTPQLQPSKGREDVCKKLETRVRKGDQAGPCKHVKTMNLDGKRDRSSA